MRVRILALLILVHLNTGCARSTAQPPKFAELADVVAPCLDSVVRVKAVARIPIPRPPTELAEPEEEGDSGYSMGSGVVVGPRLVLTCFHVVDEGVLPLIWIEGPPGAEGFVCEIVAKREDLDLALLRVVSENCPPLVPIRWGDYGALRPGDSLFAVGHPFDLRKSVQLGIVSAIDTAIEGFSPRVLMTDADINPGHSGGGLFDSHGGLVGIPVAIHVEMGLRANVGVAYAIPGDVARSFVAGAL